MNQFLKAATAAITRHGRQMTFTSITRTPDPIKGTVVEVKTNYTVQMYPKSVKVTNYNYPNLIGKNVVMFYLANNSLGFTPQVNDTILMDGQKFTVQSFDFHEALGINCMYRLIGVKG